MRYTQWHTTALCSPTRSCLLTGRNHTRNGMACITEAASGFPNASGVIPPENGQLQQILGERGWNTYMVGKWHLCPEAEMNLASSRRNWPTGRGFERFYGFLGAETNQWYPELVYDSHPVDPPRTPEEGYHLSEDLTDKALEFIKDAKVLAPEKPFFLYYAPGACHAPHHAPKEWIDRFKGRFDMGYEAMREQTLARQKELGIVPPDTELPPINPIGTPETRTGPERRAVPGAGLHAAVGLALRGGAAAVLPHGRGLRRLPRARRRPDRPAAGLPRRERPAREHDGRSSSPTTAPAARAARTARSTRTSSSTGSRTTSQENLAMIDELGGPKTYNHYPNGWAMAFNTPFKMWKRYEFSGGTSDPCIISWPAGHRGQAARSASSTTTPSTWSRRSSTRSASSRPKPSPGTCRATSTASACATASTRRRCRARARRSSTRCSARAASGTTAGRPSPPTRRISGWSNFAKDTWELYHTDVDRSETHDLAGAEPERLQEMINLWYAEAGANGAFPLDDRSALEILTTPRPLLTPPRNRYVYYPDVADVPESQAANIRNRSYAIGALVDIPAPGAQGVLFAHGARFGGHALYVKDNRLHYVYSFVGSLEQKIVADQELPTGENLILSAAFEKDGEDPPGVAVGTLSLYHGDVKVGEGRIKTQPGKFSLAGDGLCVGRDSSDPVTDDYPGTAPWAFTGGTIKRVAIDVSGEPYVDLEREAVAMMARE